jgi:hypothetical protein
MAPLQPNCARSAGAQLAFESASGARAGAPPTCILSATHLLQLCIHHNCQPHHLGPARTSEQSAQHMSAVIMCARQAAALLLLLYDTARGCWGVLC